MGSLVLIDKNGSGGFIEMDEVVALPASFQAAMAIERTRLPDA